MSRNSTALREHRRTGDFLGKALINLGFVPKEAIDATLPRRRGVCAVAFSFLGWNRR